MTLLDLTIKIKELKKQQKEMILKIMDGRPQKVVAEKTRINTARFNACLNSTYDFSEAEVSKINNACNK